MIDSHIYRDSLLKILSAVEVSDKHILITGATGLIGSCIIDLLILANERQEKRNHIYALSRSREKLLCRFSRYVSKEYFHIIEHDVINPLIDGLYFDYIIHGASNADPVTYARFPVETITTNILGGYNILEYGRKHLNCKITILSTFEVYGSTGMDVYFETDTGVIDFNVLRSCYPESKRTLEILSRCYEHEFNVNVNVARLCSVYGPTMLPSDSKAHAQFIRNALDGNDIILKSKGYQRRTYCYVLDAVSGILCVLFRGKSSESYNISNETAIASIAEVAHTIADLVGTKVVFDMPSDIEVEGFSKPQNCILDNTKLRDLGWTGNYNVKDGFRQTIEILQTINS